MIKTEAIYQWMKEATGATRFKNVVYDGTWLFATDSYRLYQVKRNQISLQAWKEAHIAEWNLPDSGGNWNQKREGKTGLLACGDFEVFNGLRAFRLEAVYKIIDLPVLHKHIVNKCELVPMPDDTDTEYWGNRYDNYFLKAALECPLFTRNNLEIALLESGVLRLSPAGTLPQTYAYIMRMGSPDES